MRVAAGRWRSVALWLSLAALAAAFSFQNIRTWDYWWHLRTGALIAEQGSVPKYDVYTYTVPGNRWIDVHWLHQLGLHAVYSLGGHTAIVWAKFAMVLLITGVLASIGYRRQRPGVSVFALALMLIVAGDRFMPRPELPTFACLAAVLALLHRHTRKGDAWVYGVVGVQLVWVNVHGLFAVGIAICGIYLVAELLRPLVHPGHSLRPERARRLAAVTLLAVLVSLLNPNGVDGALYPIQQLGMIGPAEERGFFGMLVAELLPPIGFDETMPALALSFFFGLAALAFAAMALNWTRIHAADPLLWVAFLYLALSAKRNLALFALVAAPILVRNLNEYLDARAAAGARGASSRLRAASAAALCLALASLTFDVASNRFYERLDNPRTAGFGVLEFLYPVGAADWILRERPPGPIAHHMADGGYLNWRLYPHYPVMIDGRLEVYGAQKFMDLQIPGPARFRQLDEVYHFGAILIHYSIEPSDEILWWLYLNSNWQLAFIDDVAALFVRVPDSGSPRYPELDVDSPDLFPPFDDAPSALDRKHHITRTGFYSALRRHDRALEIWERALERYPDLPLGRLTHAKLLHFSGFSAAAEAILRELLAEQPDEADLHVHIADLRLESGDLRAAKELYEAALELDPRLPQALFQLGRIHEREGDADAAVQSYLQAIARARPTERAALLARERIQALGSGTVDPVLGGEPLFEP